ncbi:MAG: FAD-dependent oxidoreductase [Gammaproteobacteria bacterium]|nr:FAD-dependent oxidoreductase [Gammaproteobacteria bacterium]
MPRDPRYDILFEPVAIGPVTARNRFYQVPHCNGMGHVYPHGEAAQRGIKAEGGWGVVSTQEVEIHPSSEWSPYIEGRLWDDGDAGRLRLMADAVHAHGSLAAIEITHNGHASANLYSRLPAMGVSRMMMDSHEPAQAFAMSKRDIADVRRWHRQAALRARAVGFDIVYVYAGHDLALAFHFITRRRNRRRDEYGGSLENRVRFVRELLEDTKDAVGDQCAVALRFAVDELVGDAGIQAAHEGREVVEMLADVPDLWDVNLSDWSNDSMSARFAEEGFQEPYTAFVKRVTNKPVVGVGRFTSPDAMVSQIKRGVLDFIGAARPSIADPFLPAKIDAGRADDIRECIGCNICVSGDMTVRPIRCTQNPTMGEEYRRGWHPEKIAPVVLAAADAATESATGVAGKSAADSAPAVLIIGGGPAGLEAAMALGQRGCRVTLAEAGAQLGGRVLRESRLPGLATWKRVADYRLAQLGKLPAVQVFTESRLDAAQVAEFARELGAAHVVIATGAAWARDGAGRAHREPIPMHHGARVISPDDVMDGDENANDETAARGRVVIYDDDHYYMANVLAEKLVAAPGVDSVELVTPAADVAAWTHNTLEQPRIEKRLHELGITVIEKHRLQRIAESQVELQHVSSEKSRAIAADTVLMVTARQPRDELYLQLNAGDGPGGEATAARDAATVRDETAARDAAATVGDETAARNSTATVGDETAARNSTATVGDSLSAAGVSSLIRIGDCLAPATIAAAVYDGHRYAREFGAPPDRDAPPFKREYVEI